MWICHKCGEAGGHNRLEQGILNWVVDNATIGMVDLAIRGETQEYWYTRGFKAETIRDLRLGYYPQLERYTIPYFEGEGDERRIANISFRASYEGQEPKYIRLPGVPSTVFLLKAGDTEVTFITEGEIDAITLWQSGISGNIIGLPGASFVNDKLIGAIPRGNRVIAICDNDTPGKRAAVKLRERIPGVRTIFPPDGIKDLNELLLRNGEGAVRETAEGPTNVDKTVPGLSESVEYRPEAIKSVPSTIYVSIPDSQPDWVVEDLWMGQALGFMGGLPKAMKSLLSLHMGYHIAEGKPFCTKRIMTPGPVILVQEEDTDHLIKRRLRTINGGLGSPNLWVLTPGVSGQHLRLDSEPAMEMLDETIRVIQPVMVILDPLSNMHSLEDENQSAPMNRMLERLRHMRDLRKTSFMIVHHLRKEGIGDTSRPGQKLRGSGVLHAKAECGLYIDRTGDILRIEVENKMNPNRVLEVKFIGNQFVYEDEMGEGIE